MLIAEDERRLADAIARGLRREGMAVDLAPDGSDALLKARVVRYDVVVLDRDLPEVHGDDVCRVMRAERPETGILMLTAAGALQDVVEGLTLGADAVERWQASLGAAQTGVVSLGQIVFLPGLQRITDVEAALGGTGGSSTAGGSASSAGAGTSGGSGTSASVAVSSQPEFVSLTTTSTTGSRTSAPNCPSGRPGQATANETAVCKPHAGSGSGKPGGKGASSGKRPTTLAALLALLKAETLELQHSRSPRGSTGSGGASGSGAGGAGRSGLGGSSGASSSASSGGSGAAGSGGSTGSAASSAASGSGASGAAGASAEPILQTTSTRLIVSVDLDATKQTEAVVGEPVTVELPSGRDVDGTITAVSPVAQSSSSSSSTSSSSSSSSSAAGGGGSSAPSATIPVTITLKRGQHVSGLDQAAVSVNFEQQKVRNVLSVPVTALLATAGGSYAVQEAAAPNRLIAVTPGPFAAGYVQVSGSQLHQGLRVTDSQG